MPGEGTGVSDVFMGVRVSVSMVPAWEGRGKYAGISDMGHG